MAAFEDNFFKSVQERKRKRESVYGAIEILRSLELDSLKRSFPKSDLRVILQAKIGDRDLRHLADAIRKIPTTFNSSNRKFLLKENLHDGIVSENDMEHFADLLTYACPLVNAIPEDELQVLLPPVGECLSCGKTLTSHNKPCKVTVFLPTYAVSTLKQCLRCTDCDVNYGYAMYGNKASGVRFYKEPRPYVEATDEAYIDRFLSNFQASLA